MSHPLEPDTEVVVSYDEPAWFTEVLTGTNDPVTGKPRWDQAFRDYIRNAMHRLELEDTSRQPVISITVTSPPGVIPAYRDDDDEAPDEVIPDPRGRHHSGKILKVTPGFKDDLLSRSPYPEDADAETREVHLP